jgi:hypothetical protein
MDLISRPKSVSQVTAIYRGNQGRISPLRIRESSIQLQDIIELCNPPPYTNGGSKIINTIHHVVSQLSEPFDLQRMSSSPALVLYHIFNLCVQGFIELVDQEKWDEDSASLIALRQTILTTLISTDQEAESDLSRFEKIIVDLTDPILSATQLDATLFNMVLREFVDTGNGETGIIGKMWNMVHIMVLN